MVPVNEEEFVNMWLSATQTQVWKSLEATLPLIQNALKKTENFTFNPRHSLSLTHWNSVALHTDPLHQGLVNDCLL